jgi:hypothetical protein
VSSGEKKKNRLQFEDGSLKTAMSRKEVNNEQAKWENEKKHKDALIRSISPSLSSLSLSPHSLTACVMRSGEKK